MFRSTIGQIVAGHGGEDDVLESHAPSAFGDARRLIGFQRKRFSGRDGTKVAIPGAAVSGNHECRRALAPALPVVGTSGAFANGVETEVFEQTPGSLKRAAGRQPQAQPLGDARARAYRG